MGQAGDQQAQLHWELQGELNKYVLGYQIFVSDKPLAGLSTAQLPAPRATWPPYHLDGDSNDWTHYQLDDLKNGERYYIHLRIVGSNQRVSAPSNEVTVIPRPEGVIKLYETSSKSFSAFDFSHLELVSSTSQNADIVFDVRQKVPLLRSPHLRQKGLRKTGIVDLKTSYQFPQFNEVPHLVLVAEEQAEVGHLFVIHTADGNYAKLQVESLGGSPPNRYVELRYCYQTLPGVTQF